jgi:hypothetical protein
VGVVVDLSGRQTPRGCSTARRRAGGVAWSRELRRPRGRLSRWILTRDARIRDILEGRLYRGQGGGCLHQRRYPARLVHESLYVPLRSYIGGRELWRGPSAPALHYHPHGVQSVVLPKLYLRGLLGGPAASAGGRLLPFSALDWYDDQYTRNRTIRCYPGMVPSHGLALQCRE